MICRFYLFISIILFPLEISLPILLYFLNKISQFFKQYFPTLDLLNKIFSNLFFIRIKFFNRKFSNFLNLSMTRIKFSNFRCTSYQCKRFNSSNKISFLNQNSSIPQTKFSFSPFQT